MTTGVIYLMTSAVRGLVKIGKCETGRYEARMKELENNGYFNVAGLRRLFAIEVEDYHEKERMLHELFEKARLDSSELFAINKDLVKELLASFEGRQIYPVNKTKDEVFDEASEKVDAAIEKKHTKTFYGIKLSELIAAGFLDEGETLYMMDARWPGKGVLEGDKVRVDGQLYSLSPGANLHQQKTNPGISNPNGWEAWGVLRNGEKVSIKNVRDEYLKIKKEVNVDDA